MDRHTGDSWTAVSPIIEMNWILSYLLSVVYGSAYWRQLDYCLADYRVMGRITTFRPTAYRIYDGGPKSL